MNLFKISRKYLSFKPLSTGLNILLLSFGLAIITMLLLVQNQFESVVSKDAEGIDLVVGAKGSPLQIILSGVYHVDFPTGNIPIKEAIGLQRNRLVKSVLPLALGDNYKGYRIVGTNHDYLDFYQVEFSDGASWTESFQVVVGAEVALKQGLKVGDSFASSHGISEGSHSHDEHLLQVVGVLKPTGKVIDRLITTSVETVWYSHDEPGEDGEHTHDHGQITLNGLPEGDESRELTTLLLQFRNPMAAVQLPRFINSRTSMQAASPTFEMARLFELLGVGIKLLQGLAVALIVIAGLGIFIALYNSLKERKYDLAVLRSIGATRFQLLQLILIEGITLTWIGAILGLVLGHVFLFFLLKTSDQGLAASLQAWTFLPGELWILVYATVVGLVASIIPAITAYQTSIAKQLTKS